MCGVHDVVSWSVIDFLWTCKMWAGTEGIGRSGVEVDPVTFVGLLNACASVATLERRQVS